MKKSIFPDFNIDIPMPSDTKIPGSYYKNIHSNQRVTGESLKPFRIECDKYEEAYARFTRAIRIAMYETFNEEKSHGISETDLAIINDHLNSGILTLRSICEFYTVIGREPLSNFESPPPRSVCISNK